MSNRRGAWLWAARLGPRAHGDLTRWFGMAVLGLACLAVTACTEKGPDDNAIDGGARLSAFDAAVTVIPNPSTPDAGMPAPVPPDASEPTPGFPPDAEASYPARLSETGLYADAASKTLAPNVHAYRPRFELWTDGAEKQRWLALPEGTRIETADPDAWRFPVGTKAWKEFRRDGVRIETRLLKKTEDGWIAIAYAWDEAQQEAIAVPFGVNGALGSPHDIPSQSDCADCHAGEPDFLLGVSLLQLAHESTSPAGAEPDAEGGLSLETLIAHDLLSEVPDPVHYPLPGSAQAQQALGVLHGNCGHCHRPDAAAWERTDLNLHLPATALDALEMTPAYQTTVGVPTDQLQQLAALRIAPGDPETSAIYLHMMSRAAQLGMPPIATRIADAQGGQAVFDWITQLEETP